MSMDLAYDHSGSWANSSDVDHESMSPTIASLASAGVLRWIVGRFFELKSARICPSCLECALHSEGHCPYQKPRTD